MALVTSTIPNLYNGISQQPISLRLPNQGEEQINGNSRVTDGLSKRLAAELLRVDHLDDLDWAEEVTDPLVKMHMLEGVDADGYKVKVQILVKTNSGMISATYFYDDPTMNYSISLGDNSYLAGVRKEDIKFLTDGDEVYILNKQVTVTMTTTGSDSEIPTQKQGSIVYAQQGYFGTKYQATIKIIDTTNDSTVITATASYSTPDSTGIDISGIQTNNIASNLKTNLQTAMTTAGGAFSNVTLEYTSLNWFRAYFASGSDPYGDTHRIQIEVFSSTARQALYAFNGTAIDFTTLPPTAPEGYVVKIQSDASTTRDDYYLKYQGKDTGWLETKKLGLAQSIDSDTLPIKLSKILSDPMAVTVAHLTIKDREVGDTESAPNPSFINHKLNDLFLFGNRLGFLAEKNVVMSRIDEHDVFYRTTVGTALSADRVDLTASIPSIRYSQLNFSIPFDKSLVLFGDNAQYSLSTNQGFDTKVSSLAPLTEYEASKLCSPVNIGNSIYFPINRPSYTGIFDLSQRTETGMTAEESTQHVPTYIKGTVIELVNSTTENMLFARTYEEKRTIYVQNRFVRNGVLEQNAWHKWTVPNDIIGIYVMGSRLFVTMVSEAGNHIIRTSIDISLKLIANTETTQIDFLPHVDLIKRLPMGSTISTVDTAADYFLPEEHLDIFLGIDDSGFLYNGLEEIEEALEEKDLWVGVRYKFSYTFSEVTPASYSQDGKEVYQYGRLSIRDAIIAYVNTGKFNVVVKPVGRQSFTSKFTGNILNLASSLLGRININTGKFKFPINNRADSVKVTIESDHPYPVTFNSVEWRGIFTNNSGRM